MESAKAAVEGERDNLASQVGTAHPSNHACWQPSALIHPSTWEPTHPITTAGSPLHPSTHPPGSPPILLATPCTQQSVRTGSCTAGSTRGKP